MMTCITVSDPFGVMFDAAMPNLAMAIDAIALSTEFSTRIARRLGVDGSVELRAIRVTRHKPGRRCVLEYDLDIAGARLTMIGKTRRRRQGSHAFRRQLALWDAGFDEHSADGIGVPQPIGVLKSCEVWLQRKVRGRTATACFDQPDAATLVVRIADAAYKLHALADRITHSRSHTIDDELRILHERFERLAESQPHLRNRLDHLLTTCEALSQTVTPPAAQTGIHRDFYGDQVIVDDASARLTLIDFDLFCAGDPAVDIGNFCAHLTEQGLREHADPARFGALEDALRTRYVSLIPTSERARMRHAIDAYELLTLARHVSLSAEIETRQHLTEPLISLTEQRLAAVLR
jgi:hypothetical protein